LIQSAKQLKREVDAVYGVAIDTPQVELSCQPCESFVTEIPPSTTGVATEQLMTVGLEKPCHHRIVSVDGSKHFQLDANEQEWLNLLHQRPKSEDNLKLTEWINKVITSAEEEKPMLRGMPVPVLEASLCPVRFDETPHPTDKRVIDTMLLTAPTVDVGLHHLVSPSMYTSPSPAFAFSEMELDKFATPSAPVGATIVHSMQDNAKAISEEFAAFMGDVNLLNACFD
jgi:hypothetical protein